ncbi:MAG: AarF/ABC1/UbiB kinase family protein [Deltaproteobacteria bacterium]|nr:AarF/ABC1/UbiB kinase family protein [Deltaproteobacteria bacterium]
MKKFFYSAIRLVTIYLLVVKYAFVFAWWTLKRFLPGGKKDEFNQNALTRFAWCFRRMLEDLGATFIKMGQIMSTRPDIFPPFFIDELKHLQDNVPPFDPRLIPHEFEFAFGKQPREIFAEFNETPIASASVAQVHEARLKTGERVAVKIRRPGVQQKVEYDLAVMRIFAKSISFIPSVEVTSPVETVEEFGNAIKGQLDLRNEANNNRRFRKNFEGNQFVGFPRLYEDYCAENILVMEFVTGYHIDDVGQTDCDPQWLARHGLRAIFQMIYKDGFVHADLHPGNFLFNNGNHVTYLDVGMVGELSDRDRENFIESFMAMADNNGPKVAECLMNFAPSHRIRDYDEYVKDVSTHVNEFFGKPLNEIEISIAVAKMVNILRKHRVRVNAAYTVVNVGLLVAEGVGRKLYPQINLNEELYPFLNELFQEMMKRRLAQMKVQAEQAAKQRAAGSAASA